MLIHGIDNLSWHALRPSQHPTKAVRKRPRLQDELDTVDAFVALGGEPDKSGFIDTARLISVVKEPILYYTTLHYTILYYTTLHYTILYYTTSYYYMTPDATSPPRAANSQLGPLSMFVLQYSIV